MVSTCFFVCFRTLFPPSKQHLADTMIRLAEINPENKSVELSIIDFKNLCLAYKIICDENPGLEDYYFRTEENARLIRQGVYF